MKNTSLSHVRPEVEGQSQETPEATPNESVVPQETEQEDPAAQTPASEGTEPASEPTITPEATPEGEEAEGTDPESGRHRARSSSCPVCRDA